MTRRCLVYIYGPQNIVPAISAVRYFGTVKCKGEGEEVYFLLHMPGFSDENILKLQKVAINLISSLHFPSPLVITDRDIQTKIKPRFSRYNSTSRRFKKMVGIESFDEIYYPHDLVGIVVELCISSYPAAKRIIFGDGMGSLYSKDYLKYIYPQSMYKSVISQVKESIINFLKGRPEPYRPDFAVAILPIDWSGHFLVNVELIVVPRRYVLKIIFDCVHNIPEIAIYTNFLLDMAPEPRFFILLTNLSDANFISPESEIDLNLNIIYNHIPKKSSIIIKRHPLSSTSIEYKLKALLSNDYDVHIISPDYDLYPVEIWSELILKSNIISIGSSIISIAHIYKKPVIYPMNEKTIRKYFPEQSWNGMKTTFIQFQAQLNSLTQWDEKSVLWVGKGGNS